MSKLLFRGAKLTNNSFGIRFLPAAWVLVSIIYALKSPILSQKIFAEDGSVYIQEALELNFIDAIFMPYSGYGDLISRLGAELIILFPIQLWSYGTYFYSTFWLALILFALVDISTATFKNRLISIIAPFSLLLLPIANFDALVSMSYLRFFFLAALFPIFFSRKQTIHNSVAILLVTMLAPLMMPLSILFLPFVLFKVLRHMTSKNSPINLIRVHLFFILSSLVQMIFIALFALGQRKLLFNSNPFEVVYLLLDRVIGSALIPGWGFVSQPPEEFNLFAIALSNRYLMRGLAAIVISLFVLCLVINIRIKNANYFRDIVVQYSFLFSAWFLISFLWAPEPRYALAIGFWFLWTTFQVLDFHVVNSSKYAYFLLMLIPLTWVMSWVPSEYRRSGDSWTENISKYQNRCADENSYISIKIAPKFNDGRQDLLLRIRCDYLL